MDIFPLLILLTRKLRLDAEGMRAEVIPLRLQQICRQVLRPQTVVETQSRAEGRGRDAPFGAGGDDVTPAFLGRVDGFVEEVIEEEVLELGVGAVGRGDVFEEDGADDAATAPHEGDFGLV